MPAYNLKTKLGREEECHFKAEQEDKTILRHEWYDLAQKAAKSIFKSPAKGLFQGGIAEQSFFGELQEVPARRRPGYYQQDLKTIY